MTDPITALFVGFVLALILVGALWLLRKRDRGSRGPRLTVHSSIHELRAIGQLSVYKVLTKEIVTEADHTWGDFGRKYLSWVLSAKKMAMIFMFEIDFSYDLRSPDFKIIESGDGYTFHMPPCLKRTHIRDIHFYDEQRTKLIPWLVPDLLNGFFSSGFTEEDRNRMKDAARNAAEAQSAALVSTLSSDVEQSAKQTLESLAHAFGAKNIEFTFSRPTQKPPPEEKAQ